MLQWLWGDIGVKIKLKSPKLTEGDKFRVLASIGGAPSPPECDECNRTAPMWSLKHLTDLPA